MKNDYLFFACLLPFTIAFVASCSGQPHSNVPENSITELEATPKTDAQIADYVVELFEDSRGNLWFGTMSKGVARYDGKALTYFSTKDGLPGSTVASIAEDPEGNLWFGTHSGLSKYDGSTFTNFTTKEGLCDNRVSNVLVDRTGNVWVGTWDGVCRYNGKDFSDFPIPKPDVEMLPYQTTMNWVTEILEDRHGNIWFGRDGYGACRYNSNFPSAGQASFTHFTKKDGLASNNVQAIYEDRLGNIWFGARVAEKDNPDAGGRSGDGGLSRYDGKAFIQYPATEGLSKNDIYAIHEDKRGNIWIGANGVGAYRYDGQNFTLYSKTDRKDLMPYGFGIQSMLEDSRGRFWFGLSGGLFHLKGDSIVNVTRNGPWN